MASLALVVSFLLVASITAAPVSDEPRYYDVDKAPELFEKFVKDYDKHYEDAADRDIHYKEFVESLKIINQANIDNPSATFGINEFADYTMEQRKNMTGLVLPPEAEI